MTQLKTKPTQSFPIITWEKLPDDFILPDDPVDNNLQPLLAAALRESLELAGLIRESMLIATNFGICAKVADETVVKAPDWVYIPSVKPLNSGVIRRSYTPRVEGQLPTIVMEFISETEGSEYSINPHYPYGKWYFYEQILKVPVYVIFHPKTPELDVYRLTEGKYVLQKPNEQNRYYLPEIELFLGLWEGQKAEMEVNWLRWWDQEGNLLLWGQERIEQQQLLLEQEKQRAEAEKQRAEQAELSLEQERLARQQLLEKLTKMGIDPDNIS
jgi:hypothetical protein